MLNDALTAFVTLLVVVDPVGIAPVFLSVTHDAVSERRAIAVRASLIGATILIGTAIGGNWLLNRLGIGLSAFRISGGVLLFAIAFEMVLGTRSLREARQAERAMTEHVRDVAAFPLAIPLIAGPGAITATLLLAGRAASDFWALSVLIGIIVGVGGACAVAFLLAERVAGALGVTGNVLLARLLGVLLAALAVQYVIDGVRTAFG
jgi:multiple antibiotic resistance protein